MKNILDEADDDSPTALEIEGVIQCNIIDTVTAASINHRGEQLV